MPAGRGGRLDANRGAPTRLSRRALERRARRRNAWFVTVLVVAGPLTWLLWPVKSLFYHIPKWYIQLILGL